MPNWLNDAIFYEIYPQSFADTNGDGIGDFQGIIDRLDYIRELGCNALWINPCFDSPFKDAGYDVRDYKKTAARYGTNEDLYRLFEEAHKRGIRVLLDLVPGHTSEEHEWFRMSGRAEKNEYSGRYIWSDFWIRGMKNHPYIGGECERNGTYMLNFFKCQPALNYGFLHPTENWQCGYEDPDAVATREAMKDVMRFWLDHGCDGFRVDMAGSLVKDDDEVQTGTCAVWQDIRKMLDDCYPEAAIVAEWSNPKLAVARGGFHMDFFLDHPGNGYNTLMRDYETGGEDNSYFRCGSDRDISAFLKEYMEQYRETAGHGYISLLTCNHDTPRPRYTLTVPELKLAFAFLFTMPGVPFLYYGDEIAMRYLDDLPTKEGGYTRTGTRTPMQWNHGKNLGFSDADAELLYLPVDPASDAPTAEDAMKDPASLYSMLKELFALRHDTPDLQADGSFDPAGTAGKAFAYRRGSLLLAVNPSSESALISDVCPGSHELFKIGEASAEENDLRIGAMSFVILQ